MAQKQRDTAVDIEQLTEVKQLANEALKGRKKLEGLHKKYMTSLHAGQVTRARTTTYNAATHDVVKNTIEPCESRLKEIFQ